MRTKFHALLLASIVVLSAGCEGPVGPAGPRGEQGVRGPQGPSGAFIQTFQITFDANTATLNSTVLSTTYDFPEITQSVEDNGFVQAYFREQDTWTAMPYTYGEESQNLDAVDYTLTFGYAWDVGVVELFYEASAPFALDFAVDRTVKIVIADAASASLSDVNWSDYRAVKERFQLDD